ncbi:MAG TPA: hypothetical protein VNZ61_18440 [Roseomonas sp.]|nr:hypothetical protein [Roseomonas sp.]
MLKQVAHVAPDDTVQPQGKLSSLASIKSAVDDTLGKERVSHYRQIAIYWELTDFSDNAIGFVGGRCRAQAKSLSAPRAVPAQARRKL